MTSKKKVGLAIFVVLLVFGISAGCTTIMRGFDRGRIPDTDEPIKPPSLTNEWEEVEIRHWTNDWQFLDETNWFRIVEINWTC